MPYITREQRENIKENNTPPENAGELNYVITLLIRNYFYKKPSYQSVNDIVGALEGAKLEFYRRVAAPYEDNKIKLNGDVY